MYHHLALELEHYIGVSRILYLLFLDFCDRCGRTYISNFLNVHYSYKFLISFPRLNGGRFLLGVAFNKYIILPKSYKWAGAKQRQGANFVFGLSPKLRLGPFDYCAP